MASNLELTTIENLPELTEFLLEVFRSAPQAPFVKSQIMRWKYFEPRSDWAGPRSYLLFGENRISAHGGVVPAAFRTPGGRVTAIRVIDWAGSRRMPAAGVNMMRKLGGFADVVLAIGGSPDAVRVFPKMKFEHRGNSDVFARVIRPWRQFRSDPFPRGWKAPLRLMRNALWSRRQLPSAPVGWNADPVERFDDTLSPSLSFQPAGFTTTERSFGMLNYMLDCPGIQFSGFLLRQSQRIRGYCMLSHVAGQTRIAEVWVDSEGAEDWEAAYALATLRAVENPETCEILAVSSTRVGREALERNGYRFRRHDPIFVLDPRQRLAGLPELNLTMLDGDEAYLWVPSYPYET